MQFTVRHLLLLLLVLITSTSRADVNETLLAYLDGSVSDTDQIMADMQVMFRSSPELIAPARSALIIEVNEAVNADDVAKVQRALNLLTGIGSVNPDWVSEALEAASFVSPENEAAYQQWQALIDDAGMMEAGNMEAAATLLAEATKLARDTFGDEHYASIASLRAEGVLARRTGDATAAYNHYRDAVSLSTEALGALHPLTLEISAYQAELFVAVGAYDEARTMLEDIASAYEQAMGEGHLYTLDARRQIADLLRYKGELDQERALWVTQCMVFARHYSAYHSATLDCDAELARRHRTSGSLNDAEILLTSISERLDASTDGLDSQALSNLLNLADVYQARGDNQAAKDLLSGLILTASQSGEHALSHNGKVYLARILMNEGQLDDAEQLADSVLRYGETAWAGSPIQYYNVLLDKGAIYQRQSRFTEAEAVFEEAMLALLDVAGMQHPSTLVAMSNLGNLFEQLGLYDEAEPLLKQTLEGMQAVLGDSHTQTARTRNNLALLYESQGNFREAEPLYNTSFDAVSEQLGPNHPDAIGMRNNLAFLYMMMEDYARAAEMFEMLVEQWAVSVGPEHQDALKSLNNLGRAYLRLGQLDQAEQTVISALTSRRQTLGENHIDTIRSRIDFGAVLLAQGRLEEARSELEAALAIAEKEIGEQHPYTFEALNNLAAVLEASGELSAAVDLRETGLNRRSVFLDRMLWVTGENAREGYIRLHRPELDAYLSLITKIDDPDKGKKAIEASLQRKGLLLKITSEIEQIAQLSDDPRLMAISAELEAARKELASLTLSGPTADTQGRHSEALYELELAVNELQGEIGRASARYRSTIAGTSADELAESLADDAVLVDYLMYNDGDQEKALAGVLIKQDGDISWDLVTFESSEDIQTAVLDYREYIQDDLADEEDIMEFGQIAHEVVWEPVAEVIGDMEYVYLIPDGVLNILPFNALMNYDEEYLIQTTDIHILTSGRDLLPNDYDLVEGEYVILAGPNYNASDIVGAEAIAAAEGRRSAALQLGIRGAGTGLRGLNFAPLPGAELEGKIITERVEANEKKSEVYFGDQAQEVVLSQIEETPEILHMATHGFFLEADDTLRKRLLKMQRSANIQVPPPGDNPLLRSGLAFAGINSNAQFLGDIDTVNDGVLTALEVLGLDLSGTRLVVLSACETGIGEIHEGEGVYGLRRSFQEAGVAEVISSLWEVSDAGTQALMTDFYDRVLSGVPARVALRETQLEMIDSIEWGYPYIWSAFMIVGSYESAGISIQ